MVGWYIARSKGFHDDSLQSIDMKKLFHLLGMNPWKKFQDHNMGIKLLVNLQFLKIRFENIILIEMNMDAYHS